MQGVVSVSMFKVGDLVMYGSIGVCRIIEIGRPSFLDKDDDTLFYFLEPVYKSGMAYAPVADKSDDIRKVITKKEANRLLSSIEDIEEDNFTTPSIQQLSQHYQSIIDQYSCEALLGLAKSILLKEIRAAKNNKKLGQIDKKFMKKTEELLYGEFAAVLKKDKEEIESIVRSKVQEA